MVAVHEEILKWLKVWKTTLLKLVIC
jgi:hypothetical protein